MDEGTSSTHQGILDMYGDFLIGTQLPSTVYTTESQNQEHFPPLTFENQTVLSHENVMSYTDMIIAAESNSQKQALNGGFDSLFEELMGLEKDGILCGHALRVLVHLNISELPDKYFKERWMPKERKYIRNKQYTIPQQLTEHNRHLRYSILSRKLNDIASDGAKSDARYLMVIAESEKITDKLDKIADEEEHQDLLEKRVGKQPITIVDDGYGDYLEDPDVARSKGRPTLPGRQKTLMEQLLSKQEITCSHCGEHDHNFGSCLKKHLPQSSLWKKKNSSKRKTTGSSSVPKEQESRKKQANKKGKT
uniref:Uncharacterized protein n=1 Tax=Avena sativa TaxID=4498 RepID=A0ACD6A694_AVESA